MGRCSVTIFVNLTAPNGLPIRINPDRVEYIGPANSQTLPGAKSVIGVGGINYPVQETVDTILQALVTEQVNVTAQISKAPVPVSPSI